MKLFILWLAISPTDMHVEQATALYAFKTVTECNVMAEKLNNQKHHIWCMKGN